MKIPADKIFWTKSKKNFHSKKLNLAKKKNLNIKKKLTNKNGFA